MADKKHLKKVILALDFISKHLNQEKIPWLLGASGALMVHGVDIIPYDLDIIVSKENVIKVEKLLSQYLKNPLHEYKDETGIYLECQLDIEGVEVEILESSSLGNPLPVNFQGSTVYINSLANELKEYKKRPGKQEIVKLIEDKIKSIRATKGICDKIPNQ